MTGPEDGLKMVRGARRERRQARVADASAVVGVADLAFDFAVAGATRVLS